MRPLYHGTQRDSIPTTSFLPSVLAQSTAHALRGLHKYKHMENAKNASQFGRRLAVFCLMSSPANGANWSQAASEANCKLEVKADPAALVFTHSWLESRWVNIGKNKPGRPRSQQCPLGQERAGTATLCSVYTHHLPSRGPPRLASKLSLWIPFKHTVTLPVTLLLEPYDGPIEGGGPHNTVRPETEMKSCDWLSHRRATTFTHFSNLLFPKFFL